MGLTIVALFWMAGTVQAQIPNTDWYTIPPGGIDGSESRPYEISNADDLAGLAKLVNGDGVTAVNFSGRHIVLTRDISLADYGKGETSWNSGRGWIPIGYVVSGTTVRTFNGIFDGNNKKITDLYINRTTASTSTNTPFGLFGHISGGRVQNIGVEGIEITTASSDYVGGIVGYATGNSTITNSYSIGNVSGTSYVGGIVGGNDNRNITITNCYFSGSVSGSGVGVNEVVAFF